MERYKSANLQQGQAATGEGTQAALSEIKSHHEQLTQKLSQFASTATEIYANKKMGEARDTAAKDDAAGKPYHRESVYTAYGRAYNNSRDATYAARSELNLTEQSAAFAEQFPNDPEKYKNSMKHYMDTMALEAPTPEIGSVISISGKKIQNHQYGKLSVAKNQEIKNQKVDTYNEFLGLQVGRAINAASIGDTKDVDLINEYTRDYTNALVLDGTITPAEAQKTLRNAEYQVDRGSDEQIMRDYIANGDFEAAEFMIDYDTPEGGDYAEHQAKTKSLHSIYNAGVKTKNANIKVQQKKNDEIGKAAIKVLKSGKTPTNIDELKTLPLSDTVRKDLNIQLDVQTVLLPYQTASLPDQLVAFNKIKGTKTGTETSVEVMDATEAYLKERMSLAKKDPVSLGQQEQITEGEPVTLEIGDKNFLSKLHKRSMEVPIRQESYGEGATNLFTEAEAKVFSEYLESAAISTEDKMNLIQQIEVGAGENAGNVYSQLAKNGAPVMGMVGSLLTTGQDQTAKKIMRGKMIMDSKIPFDVEEKEFNSALASALGNAQSEQGEGSMKSIYDSAFALYLAEVEQQGKLGGKVVSNATVKKVINDITGGVGEQNGKNYFLPRGKSKDEMEDYIDNLSVSTTKGFLGMSDTEGIQIIQRGQLISVGEGQYRVKYKGKFLYTEDNKPYIFEVK